MLRYRNFWSNRRGDTIIEVMIAIALLASTLFSAYAISSDSAQLGLAAREQDQATQLLQHQVEGLRYLRDQAEDWGSFVNAIDGPAEFYVRLNGGSDQWEVVSGRGNGEDIIDDSFEWFTTWSEVQTSVDDNRRNIVTYVEWETINGQQQTSTVDTVLANTDSLAPPPLLDPSVTCHNLDADPDSGTAPLDVDFRVSYDVEDTRVTEFEFRFGDGSGTLSEDESASHRYSTPGSYTARVIIHTEDDATDRCNTAVNVTSGVEVFNYTGSRQSYTVPSNVNEVQVDAYGAQGGHESGRSYGGGRGGHTRSTISVTPGERLWVYVGGKGGLSINRARADGGDGGWPNGGDGGDGGTTTGSGAGGGGSSDVRRGSTRLIIAAGGGGSTRRSCSNGGDGGGRTGEDGETSSDSRWGDAEGGGGGTQSSGGSGGDMGGQSGGWFAGGYGGTSSGGGAGGGGGGYYGGGGGGSRPYTCAGGGGGGSSFARGYNTIFRTGVKNNDGRVEIRPR